MTAKAYNGRVITEWLAHELRVASLGDLRHLEHIRVAHVTVMLAHHPCRKSLRDIDVTHYSHISVAYYQIFCGVHTIISTDHCSVNHFQSSTA